MRIDQFKVAVEDCNIAAKTFAFRVDPVHQQLPNPLAATTFFNNDIIRLNELTAPELAAGPKPGDSRKLIVFVSAYTPVADLQHTVEPNCKHGRLDL
jgi:hypothetical protein